MPSRSEPSSGRRRAVRSDALLNREKILSAAADIIAARGPNVPLVEIANAAGVGVGTLYRGFPDRTALMHALELRAYELVIGVLTRVANNGHTGADAVEEFLLENLKLGDQLALPLHGAPPLTDPAAVAAREQINTALERFLDQGRTEGTVHAGINATDVIMCGAMTTQPLPHGPNWAVVAKRHIALFMGGVRTLTEPLPGPAVTSRDIEIQFRTYEH
ncbi:TetR/AcrR family transcriptional regulator [Mycolicibacterium sp. P9-64]|uniref:TetR/AcrR family transcriptional regulator n=1 Tax=Mycolicibacterium sp. P9-64 TaxID=2024612 RepID=UPI0011EC316F|nr:TetR/AcrR family transcriptional regulator [Mycolicibacterium sp. P9-64]KAA0083237.1 TetR/AcrR family transcriptional regulator [Mycolicibacterium sp. P9-64]